MLRKILFIFITIILAYSCVNEKEKGNVCLSGSFSEYAGSWLFVDELEVKGRQPIDSTMISDDGSFHISFDITDAGFFILQTKLVDNYILLQIEKGEKISINSDKELFAEETRIEGSPGSELLNHFEDFMRNQKSRVDSLSEIFTVSTNEPDFYKTKLKLDSIYESILNDQKQYVKNFIDQHTESLASLIVINRKMGNSVVMDEVEDFIWFFRLDSVLYPLYPNNKHAIDHHKRVEKIRGEKFEHFFNDQKLEPGEKAPNIVMKDTAGQFISLRDLIGQKVLIYFWAGWNAQSRSDNKKLIREYNHWKANNIEIFGVSLDEHEKVWKGALNLDELPWLQGSDLLGTKSPAFKKYNLREKLPKYFMVDENGRILFKSDKFDDVKMQIEALK